MENNQNRPLDTSSYLNQGDIDAISRLTQIKRDITSYFDMDLFIGKMREIIDESAHFEFRSDNARKFIEKDRPVFIIKYTSETITNGLKQFDSEDKRVDFITDAISADIIAKFSRFITDCIRDSDKLNELFSEVPKDITEFFISNIYTIRADIDNNNIYILYFI
jgi:hypothetical protein